jgi:hypothetical protein
MFRPHAFVYIALTLCYDMTVIAPPPCTPHARPRDRVSKRILHHLSGALFHDCWKEDAKVDNVEEDNVWWIFDQLGGYVHSIFNTRERHTL